MKRPPTAPTGHQGVSHFATRQRGSESGSAYIVTLLVLVVLSTLGISLALITQTEVLIGGSDRMINLVFYAADSGIAAATSKALVEADFATAMVNVEESTGLASLGLHQEVELSPFIPSLEAPCNLCEINDVGTYSENSYRSINYMSVGIATRRGGPDQTPLAQTSVSAIVTVQPWKTATEAYLPLNDEDLLNKFFLKRF